MKADLLLMILKPLLVQLKWAVSHDAAPDQFTTNVADFAAEAEQALAALGASRPSPAPKSDWEQVNDLDEIRAEYREGFDRTYEHVPSLCDEVEWLRAQVTAVPSSSAICATCRGRGWVMRSEMRDWGLGLGSGGAWNEPCPDCTPKGGPSPAERQEKKI